MGEWHLYKLSDSLGDKLYHQSECSYQVHLQRVPPEPCPSPSPKYMQLNSQSHILSSAWPCPVLPVGGQKGNQRTYGKTQTTGHPKAPASQHWKQPCGLKSFLVESYCLPGLENDSYSSGTQLSWFPKFYIFSCSHVFFLLSLPRILSLLVY